jgi:Rrf2 family protein
MLHLNRKTDYALVALAHLATRAGGEAVSARALARQYGMPQALLANLLKELHRAGLLVSTRGANGGYQLAQATHEVTLRQVIEAIEGPIQMAMCCGEPAAAEGEAEPEECQACRIERLCPISGSIQALNGEFAAIFEAVTLEALLQGNVKHAMGRAVQGSPATDARLQVLNEPTPAGDPVSPPGDA